MPPRPILATHGTLAETRDGGVTAFGRFDETGPPNSPWRAGRRDEGTLSVVITERTGGRRAEIPGKPETAPAPLPDRYRDAVNEELAALIGAAGGRTLALFTSWKAMDLAAAAVRERVDVPILTQRDLPKPALVARFTESEATCVFATAGFFQGVDVPGRTLSLVVIDRLPFPRPDDPLLSARREQLGPSAFAQIDVPRAAMLLAQAAGRLIRNGTDRGVVVQGVGHG